MKDNISPIFWLTGLSGSGKSTLSLSIKSFLSDYRFIIIDGDAVRDKYVEKLGFSKKDVLKNNLLIADYCKEVRADYDAVLVPVISPYSDVRLKVKKILDPNFHLIYINSDLATLRDRDPKGLYSAADRGVLNDLIGYSELNPYDIPIRTNITINTSNGNSQYDSEIKIITYVESVINS